MPSSELTIASPRARNASLMPPAIGIASTSANAASTKRPSPTGNQAPRSAASTESRRSRPRRRVAFGSSTPVSPARLAMRMVASSRNGSSANSTSGPSRPSEIAFRGAGLMP